MAIPNARRIQEARLPRTKTLDDFNFSKAPQVAATRIHELAQGGYIERAEPIIFIGDCGTGKTHLLTGLCIAACRQKRRVRFATSAALVNELVEAKQQLQLRRVLARWECYELIAIDEMGHVPMADLGPSSCSGSSPSGQRRPRSSSHHYPAFFRVDAGNTQRTDLQSITGPDHGLRTHYRNRRRQLPLPADGRG